MHNHNVTLARQFQKTDTAYRMVVTARGVTGFDDNNVFLYLAMPLLDGQTEQQAVFQGVCSPWDMVDIPENRPSVNANPAWFRYHTVDLVFRSASEADAGWATLLDQVGTLTHTMYTLDTLTGNSEVFSVEGFSEGYRVEG